MNRKLKNILANMLLLTLLVPNVSVKADNILTEPKIENNSTEEVNSDIDTESSEDININTEKDNIEDKDINNEESLEEDKLSEQYEDKVTNEEGNQKNDLYTHTDDDNNLKEEHSEEDKLDNVISEQNSKELINSEYEIETIAIKSNEKSILNTSVDYNSYINERTEFELKSMEMQIYSKLKLKTDSEYEIAVSHEDGRYTYLDSAKTIDEAFNKLEESPHLLSDEDGLPVIINSDGQIVYSTYSMARIYKHIDGKPYPYFDRNTNIYSDAGLSRTFTYINQGYVDDVPILDYNGVNSAKVLVSGNEGWINMNTNSNEYDMIVVPVNQVRNPSYYNVKNGILYHFISSNLTSGNSGYSIAVGKAPSYLEQGKYYFSYDGIYFYDGSHITTGLSTLIRDYKNSTRDNAINSNNPYYSYFKCLPFRSKTNYTANDLNKFIEEYTEKESKLRNTGQAFINAQNLYGVNAVLALGIAINESGWGNSSISKEKNNIFGLNAVDSNPGLAADAFGSVTDCINDFAKNWISRGYSDPADWRYYGGFLGDKKMGTNIKYASDPFWGEKAAAYAFEMDYYLSGKNLNNLNDFNALKLIMFTGENKVIDGNGKLLYDIHPIVSGWGGYAGTVAVVSSNVEKFIDGEYWIEIYPERGTAINSGGASNKFDGNYNWDTKAIVKAKNIKFINSEQDSDWKQHWAYNEIRYAMSKTWINTSSTFRPDDSITRAEFIKIVNKAFGFTSKSTSTTFKDVNVNDWFYNDVLIAIKQGYIDSKNVNFRPNDQITRQEVAAIITSIKNNKDRNLDKIKKYHDYAEVSEWAKTSVEGAIEAKYMGQTQDKKFRPKDSITRAEAVVTLFRIVK